MVGIAQVADRLKELLDGGSLSAAPVQDLKEIGHAGGVVLEEEAASAEAARAVKDEATAPDATDPAAEDEEVDRWRALAERKYSRPAGTTAPGLRSGASPSPSPTHSTPKPSDRPSDDEGSP